MLFPEPLYRGKNKETGEWVYGYYAVEKKFGEVEHCIQANNPCGLYGLEVDPATVGMFTGFTAVWEEFEEPPAFGLSNPEPKMRCSGYDPEKCSCDHMGVHEQNKYCGNKCGPHNNAFCYPVDEQTGQGKIRRTVEKIFTGQHILQSGSIHAGVVGWNEKGGTFAVAWEDKDKRMYWVPLHLLVSVVGSQELLQCRVSDTPLDGV